MRQAHRREVLTTSANEIFALRAELGIHQEGADEAAVADPLDEAILWHLGVGDARQPKREMVPTAENVQRVEAKRKWVRPRGFRRPLRSFADRTTGPTPAA